MLGKKSGTTTRITKEQSKAPAVYCYGHSLSLAVKQLTTSCKVFGDTMGAISEIIVIRTGDGNTAWTGSLSCLCWEQLESRTQYSSRGKKCKQMLSERENLNYFWYFTSLYCIQNFSLPKVCLEQIVPYFGCTKSRTTKRLAIFGIPKKGDEWDRDWKQKLVSIIIKDREIDNDLRGQVEGKSLHIRELHFTEDQVIHCKFKYKIFI